MGQRTLFDLDVDELVLTDDELEAVEAEHHAATTLGLPVTWRDTLDVPFNSVGLNLYRDGRDSVAPHNDHLYDICEGFPIALVSLGAARRFTIRAKTLPRRVIHLDLDPGSLLVMDYATQLHYTHAVPKTTIPVAERISLAFRVKPAE